MLRGEQYSLCVWLRQANRVATSNRTAFEPLLACTNPGKPRTRAFATSVPPGDTHPTPVEGPGFDGAFQRGLWTTRTIADLPVDVGEALVSYLRRRRPPESRALFLRVFAPVGPLTGDAVGELVRAACVRAGLPLVRSHRLRHTAATEMPKAGAAMAGRRVMSDLRTALKDYLGIRRQLGFELKPHDLRNKLAARTLLDRYLAGEDVDRRMPLTSRRRGDVSRCCAASRVGSTCSRRSGVASSDCVDGGSRRAVDFESMCFSVGGAEGRPGE
jgi:hypothetical protein